MICHLMGIELDTENHIFRIVPFQGSFILSEHTRNTRDSSTKGGGLFETAPNSELLTEF